MCSIPRMTALPLQECRWRLFLRRHGLFRVELVGNG
jgi:hypothetical protein